MFGAYSATMGVRIYMADGVADAIDLGYNSFNYMLEEPRYAEVEYEDDTTAQEDFIWNHLLEREFKLDVAEALNDESAAAQA